MRGRKIAAVEVAAAAAVVAFALSESCEARHVALLAGAPAAEPGACMEMAVRIAEFNSSCPMRVQELDCG